MKEKKKSFILYDDDIECVSHLTTKQAGKLLQAIVNLRINGEVPDFGDDAAVKILFHQITSHISINEEKYKQICERNAKAAQKRWNSKDMQKDADASECIRADTKGCYNDNDNDNENDNDIDNENDNGTAKEKTSCSFPAERMLKKPNYDMSSVENFFASATAIANQGPHRGSS